MHRTAYLGMHVAGCTNPCPPHLLSIGNLSKNHRQVANVDSQYPSTIPLHNPTILTLCDLIYIIYIIYAIKLNVQKEFAYCISLGPSIYAFLMPPDFQLPAKVGLFLGNPIHRSIKPQKLFRYSEVDESIALRS